MCQRVCRIRVPGCRQRDIVQQRAVGAPKADPNELGPPAPDPDLQRVVAKPPRLNLLPSFRKNRWTNIICSQWGRYELDGKVDGMQRLVNAKPERDAELQKLADERGATLLSFVSPRLSSTPGAAISAVDEFGIEESLIQIENVYGDDSPKKERRLYLLLNTTGGSLASSFNVAMAIRRAFGDITVFVPNIAASGGTLLALVGNRIRMGPMSQLGPLDPQVWYRDRYVSANSMLAARFDLEGRLEGMSMNDISPVDRHLLESLDNVLLEEHARILDAGTSYLEEILKAAGYERDNIDNLCEQLIFRLPSHDYSVRAELAAYLGIRVEGAEANADEWDLMRRWLSQYIDQQDTRHFIRYIVPNIK